MYGKKHSLETRRKMSEAIRRRTLSPEHKRKLSEAWKGARLSADTRRKMSEALSLRKKWITN